MQALPAPVLVLLMPVAPVIVYQDYQPVIPVYQGFVVRDCDVHRLKQISYDMDSIGEGAIQGANNLDVKKLNLKFIISVLTTCK
ncbi:hypothetical protein D1007_02579 [Hordeum vulgare]|nr:hypothetical protein D1007_02579 [Hordeum vulgare]